MTSLLSESLPAVSANLLITIDKVQYKRQGVNITSLARHGLLAGFIFMSLPSYSKKVH